jgi:uncharacterized protein
MMSPIRSFANQNPLTDAEFAQLGEFLRSIKNSRAMTLEEMDGFFVALICGPELVSPGEYLPYVWGNELSNDGVFQSLEEAQKVLNLALRHWNTIAGTLHKGRVYFPFLLEAEDGMAQGNDWAKGFLRGMGLRRGSWSEFVNDEQHGGSLVPIFMLAHEHDSDPKLRPPPISRKRRKDILADLAAGIPVIYEYFRPERRAQAKA